MKNEVKVLKDGMTIGELRAADLENVCDLERELIEVILYTYENKDDDSVIDFENTETVAIGRVAGEFYITYSDDAVNMSIADAVDVIEKGEPVYWDEDWDDEEKVKEYIENEEDVCIEHFFTTTKDFKEKAENIEYEDHGWVGADYTGIHGTCEIDGKEYNFTVYYDFNRASYVVDSLFSKFNEVIFVYEKDEE